MAESEAKARALEVLGGFVGEGSDLGAMDDVLPVLTAFLSEVAADDFVCTMVGRPPLGDVTYPGIDGLAEAWHGWGEMFETVRAVLEEVRDSDDHIVLLVDQIATTRHDAVEIRQPSAMLWRFDGAQVSAVEFYLDQDRALSAAGLAES